MNIPPFIGRNGDEIMHKNKEIRSVVNEKFKPLKGKLMLYAFVYLLLTGLANGVLRLIPVVGSLAGAILAILTAIGFTATVVNVYNGND